MILSIAKLLSVIVCLLGMFMCFDAAPSAPAHAMIGVRDIAVVGALQLAPSDVRAHGDVAGYKNLAFIGKWGGVCSGKGVDIIDISTPSDPVKVAATLDHPFTSMEDMKAIRIGARDVLAIGLQECGDNTTVGKSGLELYDITVPDNPQFLSFFDVDAFGADVHGIHELDLTTTPSGRALALAAVPDLELGSGVGDFLIIDITDPGRCRQLNDVRPRPLYS